MKHDRASTGASARLINQAPQTGGKVMSIYGTECSLIDAWAQMRAADLRKKWGDAVYDVIRGSPWAMEVNVRLDDAAEKQARAERLAYMRGDPIPDENIILSELLAWVRGSESLGGGLETLPKLPWPRDGRDISGIEMLFDEATRPKARKAVDLDDIQF
jgi:hypothetical protein